MIDSAADSVLQMINTFNVNIGDILQIGDEQVGVLNIIDEGETGYREYGISRGWDGTLVSAHVVGAPVSVMSGININTGTWRAQHLIGFSNGTNITTSLTGGTIHGSQNHPYISHADRNANYTQSYSGYIRLDPGTHMFGIATDDTGEFKIFEHGDSNDTLVHCWISGNGGIDVNNPSANIPDVMYYMRVSRGESDAAHYDVHVDSNLPQLYQYEVSYTDIGGHEFLALTHSNLLNYGWYAPWAMIPATDFYVDDYSDILGEYRIPTDSVITEPGSEPHWYPLTDLTDDLDIDSRSISLIGLNIYNQALLQERMNLKIDNEIMAIDSLDKSDPTDITATVSRGIEGTLQALHLQGARILLDVNSQDTGE